MYVGFIIWNNHITTDNFFTTYKLGRDFLKQKTTFLGTIRRDKKDLPDIVKIKQKIHETIFCDDEKGSLLTIYQGKKAKNVVVLSTHHDQALIVSENNPKCKANTILTYNKTKVGVDSVDQMSRQYSVQAPSRRWPVAVFYNILKDGAGLQCKNRLTNKTFKIPPKKLIFFLYEDNNKLYLKKGYLPYWSNISV